MKPIHYVSCTKGRKESTRLLPSLERLGTDRFTFFEDNTVGLSARYNSIIEQRRGNDEIVVLVHDDVAIGDLYIVEKLNDAVSRLGYTVVGVAGNAGFQFIPDAPVTIWLQPPVEQLSGAVEYVFGDNQSRWNVFGITPKRCVVLDGLFLAVDMSRIGQVRFDERFTFHFYDLDFCLTAHTSGLVLGTTNVHVSHPSAGGYDSPAFLEAQKVFRAKWMGGPPPQRS